MSLDVLISQLEKALEANFYFLALSTALTIPDIAGAISTDSGMATKKNYVDWYDHWVRPQFYLSVKKDLQKTGLQAPNELENPFDGKECYYYRCAMIHQARSAHRKSKFSRVIFLEPNAFQGSFHYTLLEDALLIDLPSFCGEVIQGFRDWKLSAQGTTTYEKNMKVTIQRHATGLAPYIVGAPVIS